MPEDTNGREKSQRGMKIATVVMAALIIIGVGVALSGGEPEGETALETSSLSWHERAATWWSDTDFWPFDEDEVVAVADDSGDDILDTNLPADTNPPPQRVGTPTPVEPAPVAAAPPSTTSASTTTVTATTNGTTTVATTTTAKADDKKAEAVKKPIEIFQVSDKDTFEIAGRPAISVFLTGVDTMSGSALIIVSGAKAGNLTLKEGEAPQAGWAVIEDEQPLDLAKVREAATHDELHPLKLGKNVEGWCHRTGPYDCRVPEKLAKK